MSRVVIVLLTASVAFAAPAPKGKKPVLYYATKAGDTLVYEHTANGKTSEQTTTVEKVEEEDGVTTITVKRTGGGLTEKVRVSADGVTVLPTRGPGSYAVPVTLLKLPAKKGDTWDGADGKEGGRRFRFEYQGEEDVEVPAGKFKAHRVVMSVPSGVMGVPAATFTVWYAAGVGPVKLTSDERTGFAQVLKSFTPGK